MWNKKGYAYFIEIILVLALALLIFLNMPAPGSPPTEYKQAEDLREIAWQSMSNLAKLGVLNRTLEAGNFTIINRYIDEELSDTTGYIFEFYNDSGCYLSGGNSLRSPPGASCRFVNATTARDIVGVTYTYGYYRVPVSFRLYLWRML